MAQTVLKFERHFAPISLMLFAFIPLLYGGCPQGMCCPIGFNCEVKNDSCKPNSSDDCQKDAVMFSNPWYIVHEDEGPLKAKLVLTKSATENVTIQVSATSRTATGGGVDYDSGPYNVLITSGNKEATFDVPVINDELYEFDEVFFLTILTSGLPPSYLRASPHTAIVGIHEDDFYCRFSQNVYTIDEGVDENLQLNLNTRLAKNVTIRLNITDVSAEINSDYDAPQNNVTFSSTSTQRLIPIRIKKDRKLEEEESFVVIASLPEDRGFCNTTVTITDASTFASFSDLEYPVYEDEGPVNITVLLSKPELERIIVKISATPLTATGNMVDYHRQTFSVTFEPNKMRNIFSIKITDDTSIERDEETFRLDIHDFDFPPGLILGIPNMAYVYILDDDYDYRGHQYPPPTPYFTDLFNETVCGVNEGDSIDLQLHLSRYQQRGALAVEYLIKSSSTATLGEDFNLQKTEGSIRESDVIKISTVSDTQTEVDETITITAVIKDDREVTCSTTVYIVDGSNQLSFNQSTYRVHEHEGTVCPVLVRNVMTAHASDIVIRVSNINYTAIGGDDYESGPYNVTFTTGDAAVTFCININDDVRSEMEETFGLKIDVGSVVASACVIQGDPYRANVTIVDDD